jgi:hypothetical protein
MRFMPWCEPASGNAPFQVNVAMAVAMTRFKAARSPRWWVSHYSTHSTLYYLRHHYYANSV